MVISKRKTYACLLALLVVFALISAVQGVRDAMERSQDFQWSGLHMLRLHIDPWEDYLRGDPSHLILKTQVSNYLPLLYVLSAPLAFVSLGVAQAIWAVCNLAFAAFSAWMAGRFFGLRGPALLAAGCLMFMATPTRTTLGNGQYGLFVLALWCASLLTLQLDDRHAMICGISYVKFNFGPVLALFLLVRWGWRRLLVSFVPILIGAALVAWWLGEWHSAGQIVNFFFSPLRVAQTGYFPRGGDPNLMDLLEIPLLGMHMPVRWLDLVEITAACVVWVAILIASTRLRRRGGIQWQIALLGLGSFALFRHHSYDAITLLFPLCYAMSKLRRTDARLLLAIIAFFWYGDRTMNIFFSGSVWRQLLDCLLLAVAMVLTYRIGTSAEQGPVPQSDSAAITSGL